MFIKTSHKTKPKVLNKEHILVNNKYLSMLNDCQLMFYRLLQQKRKYCFKYQQPELPFLSIHPQSVKKIACAFPDAWPTNETQLLKPPASTWRLSSPASLFSLWENLAPGKKIVLRAEHKDEWDQVWSSTSCRFSRGCRHMKRCQWVLSNVRADFRCRWPSLVIKCEHVHKVLNPEISLPTAWVCAAELFLLSTFVGVLCHLKSLDSILRAADRPSILEKPSWQYTTSRKKATQRFQLSVQVSLGHQRLIRIYL